MNEAKTEKKKNMRGIFISGEVAAIVEKLLPKKEVFDHLNS